MANSREVASADLLRLRKERVHSTMLVEVLALLIFMAFMFAFVLRDEASSTNIWKVKHDRVVAELQVARRENAQLNRQVRELERANRQLLRDITGTIPANDTLVITEAQWQELINKLANAEAVVEKQQRDNAVMQERLNGRGGSDLPNCTVSPTTFIVRIDLSQSGYRVTPKWPASAASSVAEVPGLTALASGRTLSNSEFRRLAGQVKAWGRAQPVPCNFRAEVHPQHNAMSLYRAQQNAVGDTFYASYR